jgi:peptidoglycan-N-acetylglucosamine deacetylase
VTKARRTLSLAAAGAVVAAAGRWAPSIAALAPRTAGAFGVRTRFPDLDGVVLTFDDGPHPDGTAAVLAELARASARAIFFVTGEAVDRNPTLAREIVAAGHEIGIHGYFHRSRRQWTERAVLYDTRRALAMVNVATGARPRFYRPPHGTTTFAGLRAVRRLGLEPLLWSRWGKDWRGGATPDSIARAATCGIESGDVVLLHDSDAHGAAGSWRRTAAALPLVLEAIDAAGHRVVLPGG